MPVGSGILAGLDSVTHTAYEQNQIARMKQEMDFAEFWQQQQEQALQDQQEQQRLKTEAGTDYVEQQGGGPPQVAPKPFMGDPTAQGSPPPVQPPMPGQASQPMTPPNPAISAPRFGGPAPQGAPGPQPWRPSPAAPPTLGGQPPGGSGAPGGPPQVMAKPTNTPTLEDIPPKMQYQSAGDFASYLIKKNPNMPLEHVYKLVEASQPLRDRHNKEVLDEMKLEIDVNKAKEAAEKAVRAARGSTEEKDTANEKEAIVAMGGDPRKSLGEQTPQVVSRVAEYLRKKEDKQTSIHVSVGGQGLGQSSIPEKDQDKHGEAYLKTLTPARAAEVKGLAEGRMQIQNLGYRGQQRQQMLEMVGQYDPDFDLTQAPARASLRRDFASGQTSRNITAINTAIGHIGTMSELGQALANNDLQKVNQLVNVVKQETGNAEVNNYNLAKTAVSDEMMRVFRQVGASDAEAARWEQSFSAANSPDKMKGAMQVAAKLLNSRIEALGDQWTRTMGDTAKPPEIVSKRSQAVLKQLGVQTSSTSQDKDLFKQADAIIGK